MPRLGISTHHFLPSFFLCGLWVLMQIGMATSVLGAANDWAEGTLDDADGASRDHYNNAAKLAWNNYLGDWRDAANVKQGASAYATTTILDTNVPRFIPWNVTTLVREWVSGKHQNQGFFLHATSGAGPMNFRSKEYSNKSQHPQLVVQVNGATRTFYPVADTFLSDSTYRSLGDSEELNLYIDKSNVLLRFDVSSLPKNSNITSATLRLFSHKQYGSSSMVVGVYRCAQGEDVTPVAPLTGIAQGYSQDKGISNHPDVIFATSFEAADWKQEWSLTNGTIDVVADDITHQFAPFQGRALRAKIPKGSNSSMSVTYDFQEKTGSEPEEIYFRYYLRFANDWNQTVFSGKLPGISGTYGKAGWGGRKPDGTDGWSARGTYFLSINTVNPLGGTTPIGTYCYYADQPGTYGDSWVWSKKYKGYLQKNKWYSIEQYVKMNTPGVHNGVLRAWVDGVLAFEKTDILFRRVDSLKIERIWMDVYHGGKAVSPYDQHLYFDNVVVARKYIGPMKAIGTSSSSFPWNMMLFKKTESE
jgi:hypothetical protein